MTASVPICVGQLVQQKKVWFSFQGCVKIKFVKNILIVRELFERK